MSDTSTLSPKERMRLRRNERAKRAAAGDSVTGESIMSESEESVAARFSDTAAVVTDSGPPPSVPQTSQPPDTSKISMVSGNLDDLEQIEFPDVSSLEKTAELIDTVLGDEGNDSPVRKDRGKKPSMEQESEVCDDEEDAFKEVGYDSLTMSGEVEALRSAVDFLQTELQKQKTQMSALENKIDTILATVNSLSRGNEGIPARVNDLQKQITNMATENQNLRQSLEARYASMVRSQGVASSTVVAPVTEPPAELVTPGDTAVMPVPVAAPVKSIKSLPFKF